MTGEFPAEMASNAENISIWWRHHVYVMHFESYGWNWSLNAKNRWLCAYLAFRIYFTRANMMTSSNGNISALLALCAGNSPVTGEFPTQRPVMRSFDVFSDLRLNKRLNKQRQGWWFETLSRPLWRHRNYLWRNSKASQKKSRAKNRLRTSLWSQKHTRISFMYNHIITV